MPLLADDMDFDPFDPRFLSSKDGRDVPRPIGRHVSGAKYPTEEDLHRLLNPDPDEPLGVVWPHAGVIVGDPDGATRRVLHGRTLCLPASRRDAHVAGWGPTGTGKSTKVLLNMLASDIADPKRVTIALGLKGDELPFATRLLRDSGREVLFIDLDDPHASLRFNPLATDDPSAAHSVIANFANLMTNPNSHDSPFFKLFGIEGLSAAWHSNVRSFPAMLDLFSYPTAAVQKLRASDSPSARAAISFINGSSHNAQTAIAEIVGWLTPFRDPRLAKTTASHTIDLGRLFTPGNVTVIRCQESRLASIKPVYNILLQWLIDAATHAADNQHGGVTPPVSFYVEDLPAWGTIPSLIERLTTLRSRRISITAAIQSYAHLRQAYGRDAGAVEASFTNKIILPGVEQEDAEIFSRMTGEQVVAIDNGQGDAMLLQRNVLQPADIRSPAWKHFLFGQPVTFLLPEGNFQAYLCPAYLRPDLREALRRPSESGTAEKGAAGPTPPRGRTSPSAKARLQMRGITDTKDMSPQQISAFIESAKPRCAWHHTDATVRRWWAAIEARRVSRPAKILHILEELIVRDLTLNDLYDAYISTQSPTLGVAMLFLDYQTARRQHEECRERQEKSKAPGRGQDRNLFADLNDELGPDNDQ